MDALLACHQAEREEQNSWPAAQHFRVTYDVSAQAPLGILLTAREALLVIKVMKTMQISKTVLSFAACMQSLVNRPCTRFAWTHTLGFITFGGRLVHTVHREKERIVSIPSRGRFSNWSCRSLQAYYADSFHGKAVHSKKMRDKTQCTKQICFAEAQHWHFSQQFSNFAFHFICAMFCH